MVSSAVVGVGIGVMGKGVASLGLILQKVSHVRNVTGVHFCQDVRWLLGFLTYFMGNLIVIIALTMAPQVIIASLDSLVMVYNAALAPYFLDNERFTKNDLKACLLVVSGVVFVVYFGPKTNKEYTGDELLEMLLQRSFLVFTVFSLTTCAVLYGIIRYVKQTMGEKYIRDEQSVAGCLMAVAASTIPAVLSSYNLQLSKIVGELTSQSLNGGENEFVHWPIYLFIFLLVSCNTVQVITLQTALANYSALLIVPIFQVQLTLLAIVNGGIYFSEFENWGESGDGSWFWFSVGIIGCLAGIVILASRSMSDPIPHRSLNRQESSHLVRKDSFGRRQKHFKRQLSEGIVDWQEGDEVC